MHTLKQKSDIELLQATEQTIHEERRVTAKLLEHLREIDHRKLHLKMGYGSLFELLTKKFGYCESGAASRIAAMRLMREVPSVEKALESDALSLTNAAAVQRFFRAEEKRGEVYSLEKKCELTQQLEHHSRLDCEKKLLSLVPQAVALQRQERVRPVSETQSEIRFATTRPLSSENSIAETYSCRTSKVIRISYCQISYFSKVKFHFFRKSETRVSNSSCSTVTPS